MLLSGREVQLQAGTGAQAAQLSMDPSHHHHSQAEGENEISLFHSGVPVNGLAPLPWFPMQLFRTMFLMFHLHIVEFLGVSCAGPGVEHDDLCESLPAQDIPWQSFAKNSFFNLFCTDL